MYKLLGVSNTASDKEIKNAYKKLAKFWHPDKNKSPEAQEKIMQLNKAYEVLSDEERRRKYDQFGDTGDSQSAAGQGNPQGQGFTVFQSGNFFHFQFVPPGPQHHSDGVTEERFFNHLLPDSEVKPHLLYFYHDWCFQCAEIHHLWEEVKDLSELISAGVGMGSVHAHQFPGVGKYCRVDRVPSVVLLVNQKAMHYQGILSTGKLKDFVSSALSDYINELAPAGLEVFLAHAVSRNRPRVVLVSSHPRPPLFVRLTALAFSRHVDFGYVCSEASSSHPQQSLLLGRLGVARGNKALLIFKEYPEPATRVEGTHLTATILREAVEINKLLHLPRLSSPVLFDIVCPVGSGVCAILVVEGTTAYNDSVAAALRGVARKGVVAEGRDHIHFGYVDRLIQSAFVASFKQLQHDLRQCSDGELGRPVLVLQRLRYQEGMYNWFPLFCGGDEGIEKLRLHLTSSPLTNTVRFEQILDEDKTGWLVWISEKMTLYWQNTADFFSSLNIGMTPLLAMLVGSLILCFTSLLTPGSNEEREESRNGGRRREPLGTSSSHVSGQAHHQGQQDTTILSLDQGSYSELVENAPKGGIALILLIDSEDSECALRLRQLFVAAVSKHKWGYVTPCSLSIATYPAWFSELTCSCLRLDTEGAERLRSSYLQGRVAIVLACLGAKRQFCVFPDDVMVLARHGISATPVTRPSYEILEDTLGLSDEQESSNGIATMSDCSGGRSQQLEGNLLQGLDAWLERLADGTLKRHGVESWPLLR
ncbi:hypothetical protein EMCRGX_G016655 [Ephydatia muelleri]